MKPKVGLLPLYIELYDKAVPQVRPRMEAFYATIVSELEKRGLEVVSSPICRVRPEFEAAVSSFEQAGADAIVTLHLAYSPSLESAEVLAKTKLPIIVLDTTPTYSFCAGQDPAELMYNHGIHGVQDMCNLLIRNGKPFQIEAGHWEKSDVLDRVADWGKAALLASRMRNARVGLIGNPFSGMGDFAVPEEVLKDTIGLTVVRSTPEVLRSLAPTDEEIDAEIAADMARFDTIGLDPAVHRTTIAASLAVRKWIEQENLTAFTMNFMEVDQAIGLPTVPFLEASKAMARGIGYAGEGDVLTAALVGALASVYPETTFTEMFCPDWEGGSIFLNHMGEMNVHLTAEKPRLKEMDFPWTDAANPAFTVGRFKPGDACLVNLAPIQGDRYVLPWAPVTVLDVEGEDRHADSIHGWIKPRLPVKHFLDMYSRQGGTHHLVMVYGDIGWNISRFAMLMGWPPISIGG